MSNKNKTFSMEDYKKLSLWRGVPIIYLLCSDLDQNKELLKNKSVIRPIVIDGFFDNSSNTTFIQIPKVNYNVFLKYRELDHLSIR